MKKLLTKALSLVLMLALAAASIPLALRANEGPMAYDDPIVAAFGQAFATNQAHAMDAIAAFYENLPVSRMGEVIYPADFGGLYINDAGELVFLLVESNPGTTISAATQRFAAEGTNTRTVAFAYTDLRDAFDFLNFFIPSNLDNPAVANVTGIGFDVKINNILVSLAEYNEYMIALFNEQVMDAPVIDFHHSPVMFSWDLGVDYESVNYSDTPFFPVEPASAAIESFSNITVRIGDILFMRNAHNQLIRSGSIGYRAVSSISGQNEQMGFITAAHLGVATIGRPLRVGDRFYRSDGQLIGFVQLVRLDTVDAAFIAFAPGVAGNNSTVRGALLGRIENTPIGGTIILDAQHGRGRVGVVRANWSGIISFGEPTNIEFWVNGARATYQSQSGDSGGVLYCWLSPSSNGVVGIAVGEWESRPWADGGNSIFTRASDHRHFLGSGTQISPR
jgi:hypothetical protein